MSFSVHHVRRCMMSTCPIIGHGNLNYLVKVASIRFLHYKVIFPFVIDKYLKGATLRLSYYPVPPHVLPSNLSIHQRFLLEINITVVFASWWWSISIIPSTFIDWNSSVRKSYPSPTLFIHLFTYMSMDPCIFVLYGPFLFYEL